MVRTICHTPGGEKATATEKCQALVHPTRAPNYRTSPEARERGVVGVVWGMS